MWSKSLPVAKASFNTQPPEGGWAFLRLLFLAPKRFNTQPPEGGWACCLIGLYGIAVSTHSRPKAAGFWLGRG